MEKSESIKNIATALCAFQGEVEKIKKTATNPFFKSKYATLADILDIIRDPLVKNGLSFVQFPKGEHGLETLLMHTSGEWLMESYTMRPTKDDPQGAGSVITYQRRYALGAILGLNIDVDDDGNAASTDEPISIKEFGYAEELVRKSTLNDEQKELAYQALAEKDLTRAKFNKILARLKDAQPKTY